MSLQNHDCILNSITFEKKKNITIKKQKVKAEISKSKAVLSKMNITVSLTWPTP